MLWDLLHLNRDIVNWWLPAPGDPELGIRIHGIGAVELLSEVPVLQVEPDVLIGNGVPVSLLAWMGNDLPGIEEAESSPSILGKPAHPPSVGT